ncbi:MAG: hypothetical protein FWH33_04110 [Oscillospiraceae bacterium]|nr:hypothetical protein [Oscillospiraceae bacterium]
MRKRILTYVIALIMVISLIPALPATAEDKGTSLFNQQYSGLLSETNTSDRYTVTLGQPGILTVNLTRDNVVSGLGDYGSELSILNSIGTKVDGTTTGFAFPYTHQSDLLAGTYVVELAGRPGSSDTNTGTYNIRISYQAHQVEESNSTLETARVMASGLQ